MAKVSERKSGVRARTLRAQMTPAEKVVWRILHDGELAALNWRRQAPLAQYILDFVSHPARLVIEIDGAQHGAPVQSVHDVERDRALTAEGYRVLRFWNNEALYQQDGLWLAVQAAALESSARERVLRWRREHALRASSSMEEVVEPRSGETGGGDRHDLTE